MGVASKRLTYAIQTRMFGEVRRSLENKRFLLTRPANQRFGRPLISDLAKVVLVGPSEGLSCPLVKTLELFAFESSLANCYGV